MSLFPSPADPELPTASHNHRRDQHCQPRPPEAQPRATQICSAEEFQCSQFSARYSGYERKLDKGWEMTVTCRVRCYLSAWLRKSSQSPAGDIGPAMPKD